MTFRLCSVLVILVLEVTGADAARVRPPAAQQAELSASAQHGSLVGITEDSRPDVEPVSERSSAAGPATRAGERPLAPSVSRSGPPRRPPIRRRCPSRGGTSPASDPSH